MVDALFRQARCVPSPLAGGGEGGGDASSALSAATPTPIPSPQGGGEESVASLARGPDARAPGLRERRRLGARRAAASAAAKGDHRLRRDRGRSAARAAQGL